MADNMHDWITTGERALPRFVLSFAKSASGSSSNDDDDEDEDDDEDDDGDDDPDADKSDEELRAELKATRASLAKANGQSAKRRKALRAREAELEEARKPKPKSKSKSNDDDDDGPDLDTIRHEAKAEGEKAGTTRAKKAEAKAALLGAGVNPGRVVKAVGLLDLDELDLDDEGLDGVDDAIEDLRKEWPELFVKKRVKRESVAGEGDRDGSAGERRGSSRNTKTASERAAAQLLGRS